MTDVMDETTGAFERDQERVREVAYHLWLAEGMPEGRAEQHWDAAKEIVATRDGLEATLVPVEQSTSESVELPMSADVHGDMPGLTDQVDSEQAPQRVAAARDTGSSAAVTSKPSRRSKRAS